MVISMAIEHVLVRYSIECAENLWLTSTYTEKNKEINLEKFYYYKYSIIDSMIECRRMKHQPNLKNLAVDSIGQFQSVYGKNAICKFEDAK